MKYIDICLMYYKVFPLLVYYNLMGIKYLGFNSDMISTIHNFDVNRFLLKRKKRKRLKNIKIIFYLRIYI